MPEFTIYFVAGSIELNCDQCGHVNHWAPGIELDEINANADDHECGSEPDDEP